MSYLSRENSPVEEALWGRIDSEVVSAARNVLTGRRFLHVFGPLGVGAESIAVDDTDAVDEAESDGFITTQGRKFVEIPILFHDFTLFARDLESSAKNGYPADLSRAAAAAEAIAFREDQLIFFGRPDQGVEGLLTAPGTGKIKKKDWSSGENAFADVAAAVEQLISKNIYGTYSLAVSPDLYLQMQRVQQGTGLLEIDRVEKLLGSRVLRTPALGSGKAVLVASDPRNVDLVVGQDIAAAYLEQKDLNHRFRVLESILLRIKRKQAIVVFE